MPRRKGKKKKRKGTPYRGKGTDDYMNVVELAVDNHMLGGSVSAARQRRGARRTGHSHDDIYDTIGRLEHLKKKKKRGKK